MQISRDNDQKTAFISKKLQLQNLFQLSFTKLNQFSKLPVLSRQAMAHNATASLEKLACTYYVDFGKSQDRLRRFSWSKKIPITCMKNSKF